MNIRRKSEPKQSVFVLLGAATAAFVIAAIASCTHSENKATLAMVDKQIDNGHIVPLVEAGQYDILNEYDHLLPEPHNDLLGVELCADQVRFLRSGGSTHLQLGLSTQSAPPAASNIHFLMQVDESSEPKTTARIDTIIQEAAAYFSELPEDSQITVDWINDPIKATYAELPQLGKYTPDNAEDLPEPQNLEEFVRSYLFFPQDAGKHHFIVVVDKHDDLDSRQKTNLKDMAEYLTARGSSLSAIAVGADPDASFLSEFSAAGSGMFHVWTPELQVRQWLSDEVANMHAPYLERVRVTLEFGQGVGVQRFLTETPISHGAQTAVFTISKIKRGAQRVFLAKINIPTAQQPDSLLLVKAHVEYFDPIGNRYHSAQNQLSASYTDDINIARTEHNPLVQRSLLILNTIESLNEVSMAVQEQRAYKGMAILAKQSERLRTLGAELDDPALERDARILQRYSRRLFNFTGENFQNLKLWKDVNWRKDRRLMSSLR